MADTTRLVLPLLSASQAQKHVTVNEALNLLDAIVQAGVIDKDLTAPPGSPSEGDMYIVGASATGAWASHDDDFAVYQNGAWVFVTPLNGFISWVTDEEVFYVYDSGWSSLAGLLGASSPTANGAQTKVFCVEEELTALSGASVTTTIAFPNQCIILGASVRVTSAITGATSFDCGDGSTVARFGGTLGISLGSTNQGTIGPAGNYASTTVTLTANGGNFTGGSVRVALHYMVNQPPQS
jgi:hypothetical protein